MNSGSIVRARRASVSMLLLCAGALMAQGALGAPAAKVTVAAKVSSSEQRQEIGLTVYNDGFGLVREVRDVDLGSGRVALEFRDVSAQIQPETVAIHSLAAAGALHVLEQNYRYDLLSPEKLLEKYVGKQIKIYRWNEKEGKEDSFAADVLSVAGGRTVLKINGEITYDFPGRFAFPEVPSNLIAKPTLVWLLDSTAPKQKVEVSYLTRGFGWQADYVFVLADDDAKGDLTGWVTLSNTTGASYENAKLKLVAGNVQHFAAPMGGAMAEEKEAAADDAPKTGFAEEGFFEYHLYTLAQPTNLLDNEQKQVTLLEGNGVQVDKKLLFYGQQYYYRGAYGEPMSNQKVGVYLDIQNTEKNHLGIALPKGTVRVYKADKSGAKQFIGEDHIDHTPRDEKVRIKMGDSFDVVADRKQMEWKAIGGCTSESAWEISVRNHKDEPATVQVWEPVGGDWTILSSSQPAIKQDAFTFTFDVKVDKKGETKVKYRVRVKWC